MHHVHVLHVQDIQQLLLQLLLLTHYRANS